MALFGLIGTSENLYFPGCVSSAFLENIVENYKKILKKLGVDFKLQKSARCCGGFLDEAGFEKPLRKISKENKDFFEKNGFKKIITNCPLCYNTFKNYKNFMPDWNIEVEFITTTITNKLRESKNLTMSFFSEPIVYYDSCYLGRYSNLHDEPRKLLESLGYTLIELPKNREETLCCGSCGNLPETNPELADSIARNFIKSIQRKQIRKIVTADAKAYYSLQKNLEKMGIKSEEIVLMEFSEALCLSMGI